MCLFFFKEERAEKVPLSLVGSGKCRRSSGPCGGQEQKKKKMVCATMLVHIFRMTWHVPATFCLLYKSNAADEGEGVDVGGRLSIKEKHNISHAF